MRARSHRHMTAEPIVDPRATHDQDVGQFDRWALRYERSKWQRLVFDRVHGRALGLADAWPEPASVLDVGCGSGRLLRAAHRRWPNARLVGIDPSSGMIEAARRLTPAEVHLTGAESIPLPDASIDVAFSTIAFHHWSDAGQGLREVARVLRPGGHFVLIDNIGPDWLARYLKDRPYLTPDERIGVWSANRLRVLDQRKMFLFPLLPILLATVSTPEHPGVRP
jgi:ubiquinone/menaquinone biosynthesis C-methylase UbiE